jgi:small subunit ribosomal protein S7|tara:strand:- start:2622 stop:3212 length:591 start_codon:yes stop_codon:yes gene_type:complete
MKIFDTWDVSEIKVMDKGLEKYINLNQVLVPRSSGRNVKVKFHKTYYTIIERLMNRLMGAGHKGKKHKYSSGHNTGKSAKLYNLIFKSLKIVEEKLKKNPMEVFVKAVENAAPREEITTIEYGGARYPKSVECSPQRRIDLVLRNMTQGAYSKSFNKKKKAEEALAEEIINAYNLSMESNAVAKKLELERQADSAR